MPRGRDRTEDPHQTTRATNGTVIKAESEDRDSIGRSSRTTSAHDVEGMRRDHRALCANSTLAESRRAPCPVPCPRPRRESAAPDSRSPAATDPCAGRGGTRPDPRDAARHPISTTTRASAHSRSTSILPKPSNAIGRSTLTLKSPSRLRQRLQTPIEKRLGTHFARGWRLRLLEEPAERRARTGSPAAYRRRRERAAARWQSSRASRLGLRAASRLPASPEWRWPAGESCSRRPHSRGNADRTSAPASAR